MKKIYFLLVTLLSLSNAFSQNYFVDQPLTGLNQPVDFAFIPGGTKVIVTHKLSNAAVYDLSNNTLVSNFWTFTDSLNNNFERGVLGVCLDPNFSTNHY